MTDRSPDRTARPSHPPLDGIRILDLTRVMAGPFATALLADLGAEVIKLEPPSGDDYRHIGPFSGGESALFLLMNRGKKSISIDLKNPAGRKLARNLAVACDVVVENFRPGVAGRLGLGYGELQALKPDIIYASISGFGQEGPFADRPAYDLIVQAMSGMMAATGEENGDPLRAGESVGDLAAGLYASWAILAALFRKERTGDGACIDVAMFDSLYSLLPTSHAQYFYGGRIPERVGNRHPLSTPFGGFRTADGHAVIAVLNEPQFARLAELIGHAGIENDPRFCSDPARTENEPVLREMIEGWTGERSTEDVVSALIGAGIAAGPILDIRQASGSEHAKARGLARPLPHPSLGEAVTIGQPVRFDGVKFGPEFSAPLLGANSAEILSGLCGLSRSEIDGLVASRVIRPGADNE